MCGLVWAVHCCDDFNNYPFDRVLWLSTLTMSTLIGFKLRGMLSRSNGSTDDQVDHPGKGPRFVRLRHRLLTFSLHLPKQASAQTRVTLTHTPMAAASCRNILTLAGMPTRFNITDV